MLFEIFLGPFALYIATYPDLSLFLNLYLSVCYLYLSLYHCQANEVGVDLQLLFTANTVLADELIHGDFHRLSQVIRNLLSNALKFTPREGSVTVDAHCVPSESTDEGGSRNGRSRVVRVTVTDSGVGMSPVRVGVRWRDCVM